MSSSPETEEHKNIHNEKKRDLKDAQIELVKLQRHVIKTGQKILITLEGRDSCFWRDRSV